MSGRLNAFAQCRQDSHDFDTQRKDAADAAQAEVRLQASFGGIQSTITKREKKSNNDRRIVLTFKRLT